MKTFFLLHFFEGGDLKIQLPLSLKGVNIGMTLLLLMEITGYEVLIVFCVERPSEGVPYVHIFQTSRQLKTVFTYHKVSSYPKSI